MCVFQRGTSLASLLLLVFGAFSIAQIKIPDIKKPKIEILSRFAKSEPVLTTSFEDAIFSVEFLDGYDPDEFENMRDMERSEDGAFLLPPGNYQLEAESFCLHAGSYGPGEGDGYMLAEWKGKRAPEIIAILRESVFHPEISQKDIQMLLWGVLAKTNIDDMPDDLQRTANALLAPEQIKNLRGGLLSYLPDQLKGAAYSRLPEIAKSALRAEAEINELLSAGYSNYEELERIAVLTGVPEDQGPVTPEGRWSLSKEGYFVRFLPEHYTDTVIQVIVPEKHTIFRDSLGRIIAIEDSIGKRFETDYDDSIEPISVAGDPGVKAYYFRQHRLITPVAGRPGEFEVIEYKSEGWTFVGIPNGKGRFPQFDNEHEDIVSGPAISGHFAAPFFDPDWNEMNGRYEKAKGLRQKYLDFQRRTDLSSTKSGKAISDITDVQHYKDGLEAAKGADPAAKSDWFQEHTSRVLKAWIYCSNKLAGLGDKEEKKVKTVRPHMLGALPGVGNFQRLGMSGR